MGVAYGLCLKIVYLQNGKKVFLKTWWRNQFDYFFIIFLVPYIISLDLNSGH